VAYYGPEHLARVRLIRALQEHGFTLAAIERRLSEVPMSSSAEELSVQCALLTAWRPGTWEVVSRVQLDDRAGRRLDEDDIAWLARVGAVRVRGDEFRVLPLLRLAVELHDAGLPPEAITDADEAVRRHMAELADELTGILRSRVLDRYVGADVSREDADQLERTLGNVRALTLDAIVNAFQHSASQVALRALKLPDD
jgi:DNA-binding transcriptional MerR regulator